MAPPKVVELLSTSVSFTVHDVKWVPHSARFVVLGAQPKGTGTLEVRS
jgi:uncharacterized protein with WD repeat